MTAATIAGQRFDMGRVIRMTFGSIRRNWKVFGLLTVALSAGPLLVMNVLQTQWMGGAGALSLNSLAVFALWLAVVLVYVAGYLILQAALVHGVVSDLNDRPAGFGDCLSTGIRNALPILGTGIIVGVATMFGFLVFVVPGVLMMLAWSVAVPSLVAERTGVSGALSRSADLTRNYRGAILGLFFLYGVVSWILGAFIFALSGGLAVFTNPAAAATFGTNPVSIILSSLVQVVQELISAAGIAAIYYELRSIKEGIGPEALASVFD
jgi:hypothetical protein